MPADQDSREVTEAAREREWRRVGFLRDLFLGRFHLELVHPYPDEPRRPEFLAFYDALENVLRTKVDPVATDATGGKYPEEVLQGLREVGAFGMTIPVEYGGLGLSQREYERAMTLIGGVDANVAALVSAHQAIGVPQPLLLFGSEEQKREYFDGSGGRGGRGTGTSGRSRSTCASSNACSRKLARAIFDGMLRYGGALERRQAFLSRAVDVATELFAMAVVASRGLSPRAGMRRSPRRPGSWISSAATGDAGFTTSHDLFRGLCSASPERPIPVTATPTEPVHRTTGVESLGPGHGDRDERRAEAHREPSGVRTHDSRPGDRAAHRPDAHAGRDRHLVMLELEAMGLERVRTELSAQYVDHNLLAGGPARTPTTTSSSRARAGDSASGTAGLATA